MVVRQFGRDGKFLTDFDYASYLEDLTVWNLF